ncbi:MAG: glycosyltransferase family 4 protein [Spirochaetes bacterium]|nr:glycosyltransferase family 4 protein [Spirochaetota bacterium]
MKNIGFISTRICGTDGVSHEIEKWATVLEKNGMSCSYCAGEVDRPLERCFLIDEAHFRHPEIANINRDIFGRTVRNAETTKLIHTMTAHLKSELTKYIRQFDLDCIIAENALSIPMNIPLGIALTELIAETGIAVIAHHHDFSWERDRFLVNAAWDYLQMCFPPVLPSIFHVVINSLAQSTLAFRRGVPSVIIPNTIDYANPPKPVSPAAIKCIRDTAGVAPGEYFVLQPTRVVPRKCIERSIDLVSGLSGAGRRLVISHPSGDEGDEYHAQLKEYANMRQVSLVSIESVVSPGRMVSEQRPFTIGEVYQAADLVTYPSAYEGFGNAFLEAVYFRKPILINRYPIFISDIEPKGFELCLINGFITGDVIRNVERILCDPDALKKMVDLNYRVASEHFSYEYLEKLLIGVLGCLKPRLSCR